MNPSDHDRGPLPGAAGAALGVGLVTVTVALFVLAEWHVASFRRGMGWLAGRMGLLLYGVVAVAIVWSLVLRFRPAAAASATGPARGERLARFRFLAFPAAMAGSILASLVPLFGTWARASPPINVAGVVPYLDGTLWFGGAGRLLFDGALDDYTGKRPLSPALFAVRLALTHLDLRMAMVLQAVLVGAACCLLARVVARHLGLPAGLALLAGLYGFVGPFAATTFTENLGVVVGALAAAVLWSALHDRSARLFAAGLFLLTVALSVRPGAMPALVLLPLWFARSERGTGGRLVNWPVLRLGVVAVVAGLAVNALASFSTGNNPADVNGNSMYMVYGLANGYPGWDVANQGWGRVFVDHPEILPLDEEGRSAAVRKLALRAIRDDPSRFATSLLRSGLNYGRVAGRHATVTTNVVVRTGLALAVLLVGALALHRRRGEGWARLLADGGLFVTSLLCLPVLLVWSALAGLPAWLGGVLALGFFAAFVVVGTARVITARHSGLLLVTMAGGVIALPLIGLDSARVLAATAPLMTLPLALAVSVLARAAPAAPGGDAIEPRAVAHRNRWSPVVAGGVLVAAALVGTPIAAAAVDKPDVAVRTCPDGRPAQALIGAVSVRIVEDDDAESSVDTIDVATATRYLGAILGLGEVGSLVRPGSTIAAGINERGDDRIAFLDGPVRATGSSALYFCGDELRDPVSAGLTLFWPNPVNFAFMTGTPLAP